MLKSAQVPATPEATYGLLTRFIQAGIKINGNGAGFAPLMTPKPLLLLLGDYHPIKVGADAGNWFFEGTALLNAFYEVDATLAKEVYCDP